MSRFHPLTLSDVRRETADAVSLAFVVPPELAADFAWQPGQYLTLRTLVDGEDVRRSYSICAGPEDGELRVAVKHVEGGRFSGHANTGLKPGEVIEVMPPTGRFTLSPATGPRLVLCFAAGSGITPIISIIRDLLAREPETRVMLFYGNRTIGSILFREALEDLKNRYLTRLSITHVLSREKQDVPLLNGRLDAGKVRAFTGRLFDPAVVDDVLICGPARMVADVEEVLTKAGIDRTRIRHELFLAPDAAPQTPRKPAAPAGTRAGNARVTVILDGLRTEIAVPFEGGISVIEAAGKQGVDLPYSCKGGVCSTCRCMTRAGEVEMMLNYSLEQWETDAGYVLACQTRPLSDEVILDFDEA
ncbi:MAG: phenylacetate-CoA oxygenase/reductase subunit PaaK [Alphaproteobacteria bacterium]|nr:phenylacetate-CoA oxygenase/reductase subunit PaaK [Alphaproteobacteria bacterium]